MATDDARSILGRLAGREAHDNGNDPPPVADYRETIERASGDIDDLESAAEFVEEDGLARLESAVEHAEDDLSDCASEGRETLRTYRAFQETARGEHTESTDVRPVQG